MISESVVPKDYLADHQWTALRKIENGKILKGGVGTGKSRVAAAYAKINHTPKDIYVITTARKRDELDWIDEFLKLGIYTKEGFEPGAAAGNLVLLGAGVDEQGGRNSDNNGGSGSGESAAVLQADDRGALSSRGTVGESSKAPGGDAGLSMADAPYPFVLTVDSWNNIAKYADVAGAFFIFDEQRLVGPGKWSRKFLRIAKRNDWILLSATPGDSWMDYVTVFVANNFYKNRTEFIREHVIYSRFTKFPKVERYVGQGRLLRQRAQLLVEMPYLRATTQHPVEVVLPFDKEALDVVLKERWHIYEERPLKDVAEMFTVARRVVNGDPSRLEMVANLWEQIPRLIVFYNFNYELYSLRSLAPLQSSSSVSTPSRTSTSFSSGKTMKLRDKHPPTSLRSASQALVVPPTTSTATLEIPSSSSLSGGSSGAAPTVGVLGRKTTSRNTGPKTEPFATPAGTAFAEWNGHKHEPVPTTDRWLYAVQYAAGNDAWNCTATDSMILYSQNYSWKIREQAKGRIDRLNTLYKDLWYYVFTSNSWVDRAITRSLDAKETFNASKYAGLFA